MQPSLRLRVYKRVRISLYRQWVMGNELTQNKSEQHICGRESLLQDKDVQFFNLT